MTAELVEFRFATALEEKLAGPIPLLCLWTHGRCACDRTWLCCWWWRWAAWRWRRAEASRPRMMPGPATAGPVPGAAARGAAARELTVLTRPPTVAEACGQFASTLCSAARGLRPVRPSALLRRQRDLHVAGDAGLHARSRGPRQNQTTDGHGGLRARREQRHLRRPAGQRLPGFLSDQAGQQVER